MHRASFLTALGIALVLGGPAAAAPPAHGTFASGGASLTYASYGSGRTVIVLAGGPGLNAAYMAPLARDVAALGYRAIDLDQRGTGGSAAAGRDAAMLTQAGTVADIEALRVALHQDRLTFVTHSFGGGMAMAYAAAHPSRVAAMILVGSVGGNLRGVDAFGAILMTHLTPAERAAYKAASAHNPEAALNIQILAEFVDRAKARATIAGEPHPLIYPKISNAIYTGFEKTYHLAPMPAFAAPITLITGAEDAALVMQPSLLHAFPSAKRVPIAHSGHWPWIENPTDFNAALKAALAVQR